MTLRLIPIALMATALFAQAPGHFGPRGMAAGKTTAIQSYLNLTEAQITSLQQLRQSEAAALKPIYQQMGPMRQSLRTQEQSGSADAATVGKLVLDMKSLEQQAAPIRASFQQQAQAVLTADQKTKLAALQSAAALMPAIHEAGSLNLLTPPAGSEGGPRAMARGRFGH
jgi:Spy/CpxP family protein refolding chaperone